LLHRGIALNERAVNLACAASAWGRSARLLCWTIAAETTLTTARSHRKGHSDISSSYNVHNADYRYARALWYRIKTIDNFHLIENEGESDTAASNVLKDKYRLCQWCKADTPSRRTALRHVGHHQHHQAELSW